jgi:7-cyano-7-deazaguanine synthase in queuosine biosynthesis
MNDAAPQMITEERAGPIDKAVLLFSGGLDSVCYAHLLQPDLLLYIPTGARYEATESWWVSQLLFQNMLPQNSEFLTLGGALDLGRYERDDLIVPNRNAHLLMLASHYGDTLYLSSVEGDRSTDKDEQFYALMTVLLDHTWSEQHWCARRRFKIEAPYKHLTKRQLVRAYLDAGGNPDAFRVSYSCYRGERKHCGVCKPCFRKRVALELNDIRLKDYWEGDFWHTRWYTDLYPLIKAGEYRGAEDRDVIAFANRIR